MSDLNSLDKIVSLAKSRGFIFQSSEIYGGLAAVYDYGPLGVELKRRVNEAWWTAMTQKHENIVGVDAAILMHPKVWKASGHVDGFSDPMIDDKESKRRYRADMLIEDHIRKIEEKGDAARAAELQHKLDTCGTRKSMTEDLYDIIMEEEIRSPDSGAFNWTDVRQFNLMFNTQFGATAAGEDTKVYLRPETAQGIFVNFNNVMNTARQQVPFGIAQIGKAFRNEVVARQFVFRMREFEQMEMQYFVAPGSDEEWYLRWKEERIGWHKSIGIRVKNLRFLDHPQDKLAHYAKSAVDVQYRFPIGWQEVEGIHNRTDFDLSQHQEFSGKKLEYFDPQTKERFVPYVIETSIGLDRCVLMTLCDAYREEEVTDEKGKTETRTVLKLHPKLAPITAGVFPLIKKPELMEKARAIQAELSETWRVQFDEKGSIGKRYRRLDEAGTPYCITVDFESLEDQSVTVRHRDSMQQERVAIDALERYIRDQIKSWQPES
ncbi:MAG: glycine--tRNA ligase [Balneolales bacterium]|nr:glycine--tRNA ligase [Balneolales bacterium]